MKSVLIAIQPYYVFLIIAHLMGWDILQEKTVEVRKDYPKDPAWDKTVHIYCSKNRKSFNRIPKQYQPFMKKLLGKVIGEFVCDKIGELYQCNSGFVEENACIGRYEYFKYLGIPYDIHGGYDKKCYGWHISNLVIYDKPKELGEFYRPIKYNSRGPICGTKHERMDLDEWDCETVFGIETNGKGCLLENCPRLKAFRQIKSAPQSWRYVEA